MSTLPDESELEGHVENQCHLQEAEDRNAW